MPLRSVFKGNIVSGVHSLPNVRAQQLITYLILTNKSAGVLTLNLRIKDKQNVEVNIAPFNMQLAAGTSYTDGKLVLLADENLVIETTASLDYYFVMEPS